MVQDPTLGLVCALAQLGSGVPMACAVCGGRESSTDLLRAFLAYFALQGAMGLTLGALGLADAPVVVGAVSLGVLLLGVKLLRRTHDADEESANLEFPVGLGVATAALAPPAWLALTAPLANFDSLAYHLPSLAHWAQEGSFATVEFLGLQKCYPLTSLATALPATGLAGSDLPVSALALVAVAGLGIAVYRLARESGARRVPALAGATVLLATPVVLRATSSIQPDVVLAAAFVGALSCMMTYRRLGLRRDMWLAALALALLPGYKSSGWAYLALGLGSAIVLWRGARPARRREALVVVAGFGLACFWPVRAWLVCGNPLGAGELSFAQLTGTTLASAFRPLDPEDWRTLGWVLRDALGPFLLLLGAGIVALAAARREARGVGVLVALSVACIVVYTITPFSADNGRHDMRLSPWSASAVRYALPALAIATALAARSVSRVPGVAWPMVGFAALAVAFGLHREMPLPWREACIAPVLGAASFTLLLFLRPRLPSARWVVAIGFVLMGAAVLAAAPERLRLREAAYGRFLVELDAELPPGAALAFFGLERPGALYGPRLQRPVVGLPATANGAPAFEDWLRELDTREVRFLVVRSRGSSPELDPLLRETVASLVANPNWSLVESSRDQAHMHLFASTARVAPN